MGQPLDSRSWPGPPLAHSACRRAPRTHLPAVRYPTFRRSPSRIAALPAVQASANFSVGDDGAGHLQFTTTSVGSGVSIKLEDAAAKDLLQRLGFGAVTSLTKSGTTGVPPTVTVASYDIQSNSLTLTSTLPVRLDVNDVYAVVSVPTPAVGPKFIARTPGPWSSGVTVSIANSDRSPTQVTGPVATGLAKVPIQSVTGIYVGAIVEIDHNAISRSIHQVKEINSSTGVITIDPPLPSPKLTVVVNPLTDNPAWVRTLEIDIVVTDNTGVTPSETYRGLSWNQTTGADLRRHYAWTINANSSLVWCEPPGVGSPALPGSEGITLDGAAHDHRRLPHEARHAWGSRPSTTLTTRGRASTVVPWSPTGIESLNDLTDGRGSSPHPAAFQAIQLGRFLAV